jgi:hypothetical protein
MTSREKKYKVKNPPAFAGVVTQLEYDGEISRNELRLVLDGLFEFQSHLDQLAASERQQDQVQ